MLDVTDASFIVGKECDNSRHDVDGRVRTAGITECQLLFVTFLGTLPTVVLIDKY